MPIVGTCEPLGDVGGEPVRAGPRARRRSSPHPPGPGRRPRASRVGGAVRPWTRQPAEGVHALRCEADVALDGDAGAHDGPHGVDVRADRPRASRRPCRLLEEAARVAHGLGGVGLVAHEGHVADQQRAPVAPRLTARAWWSISSMVTDRVLGWPRTTMASESPTRIASIARFVDDARGGIVVGGQHRDGLAAPPLLGKAQYRGLGSRHGGGCGFGSRAHGFAPPCVRRRQSSTDRRPICGSTSIEQR